MNFVKTFEQFKNAPMNEAAEPKQIQAKDGELARWRIVVRSRDEETISDKNPSQTLVRELSEYGGFKTWWNSKVSGIPNQKALAVIYTGVTGKTNIFGKEVAKAEVAFYPYLEQAVGVVAKAGGAAAVVKYDVSKAEPVATVQVEGSDVPLMVWHAEDLSKLKIDYQPGFIRAKNKNGGLIPFDLVNPPYMYKNGLGGAADAAKAEQPAETPAQTTAATSTTQAAEVKASLEMIAVTDKFIGLKINNAFNQLVKDLQEIIIKNGTGARPTDSNLVKDYDTRVSAATKVRTDGGADGRYGNATGGAIGVLIGTNSVVPEVTKEVADKLANSFTAITPAEAAALIGAIKKGGSTKSAGGSTNSASGSAKKPKPNPGF